MLGGWVSPEEIRVDFINVPTFVGVSCFVDQVMMHDVIVKLRDPRTLRENPMTLRWLIPVFSRVGSRSPSCVTREKHER